MRRFFLQFVMALGLLARVAASGLDQPQAVGAYLNGVFPQATPGPSGAWSLVEAFPSLTFVDPVRMVKDPLSAEHVYVVCRNGEIWRIPFSSSATNQQKVRFLDRKANTWGYWDAGMMSMVFHPDFGKAGNPNRGYVYVFYQYVPQRPNPQRVNSPSYMRLSRFTVPDGQVAADPASEYVMIQQFDQHNWHNGGQMFFGPEGFLYLAIGDEGDADDSYDVAQKINDRLFSGILRIDVDRDSSRSHPIRRQPRQISMPSGWAQSFTQGYFIPNDNPWQDPAGGILEEFWSIGTRSPHSMHYDKVTGDIWVAEVGQGAREEITVARKGGNHQWPYMEGKIAGRRTKPANLIGTEVPPIYDYGRTMGGCVIGGVVYRGSRHSATLNGRYVFGDHNTRAIYALSQEGGTVTAEYLTSVSRSGGDKSGLAGICEGPDGELYFMELGDTGTNTGKIYRLTRSGQVIADPPRYLSQTGAFSDVRGLEPAAGLIPYEVNSPLWTDGAAKRRWVAIPNDGSHDTLAERVVYRSTGAWEFPVGTVLVKHFALPVDERNPEVVKPVETRFFVHGSDGKYYGVTYQWNEEGTDAELLEGGAARDFEIVLEDGSTRTQRWDFPSRADCRTCHTMAADNVLGLRSHQMAREITYPLTGRTADQLATWNHLGIFGASFGTTDPAAVPRAVDPGNPHASLDHRVKSYLDANCAHCHHPGGVAANFDASFHVPLAAQSLINGALNRPTGEDDRVVAPGDPHLSLVHARSSIAGPWQMPPLGKNLVDGKAAELIEDWIRSLDAASFPLTTVQGVKGSYYSGRNFEQLAFTRTDSTIDFDWGSGSPGSGLGVDNFSVRWQAKIIPAGSGNYTFHATTDDGVRVKINGTTVIDHWADQSATERSGGIALTAGVPVDLEMEYYEAGGSASARLAWSGPGISKRTIPASVYRLPSAGQGTPVAGDDAVTAVHGAATPLDVLGNDSDPDAPLGIHGVAVLEPPRHGTVRIHGAEKRLVYTHDGSAARRDSFSYTVTDPDGRSSNVARVDLSVPFDFAAWVAATPGAGGSAGSNADGDLYPDLLEFALGGLPDDGAEPTGGALGLVEDEGGISFQVRRPAELSGVIYRAETSGDLATWHPLEEASVFPAEDGFEWLRFASLENRPEISEDGGFVRLRVDLEGAEESRVTLPLGWKAVTFGGGVRTFGVPFRQAPVFSSKVVSQEGGALKVHGTPVVEAGFRGYVEVADGAFAGHRFEVESVGEGEIRVNGGGAMTLEALPGLEGASIVLCAYDTLAGILDKERFAGSTNPGAADQVQFYVNDGSGPEGFRVYYLLDARPGNPVHQWRGFIPGGGSQDGRTILPGEGMYVKRAAGAAPVRLLLKGQVRANAFAQPLRRGFNLLASPYPLVSSPRGRGMSDPAVFHASTGIQQADQFLLYQSGRFRVFYLLDHPTQPDPWRETVPGSPDYSEVPLFGPDAAFFIRRNEPSNGYVVPLPWSPTPPY